MRARRACAFDISQLAERLVDTTDWLTQFPDTKNFPIGYFVNISDQAAQLGELVEQVQYDCDALLVDTEIDPGIADHLRARETVVGN